MTDKINEIKTQLLKKQISLIKAAKLLSAHNGNPFAFNFKIVQNWLK